NSPVQINYYASTTTKDWLFLPTSDNRIVMIVFYPTSRLNGREAGYFEFLSTDSKPRLGYKKPVILVADKAPDRLFFYLNGRGDDILQKTQGPFELIQAPYTDQFLEDRPFFFQDEKQTFLVS